MANTLGVPYEQLAEQFLQQQGLQSLTNNFRCKLGEIDLIMRDGATLVFIEVKYRASNTFGGAMAAVSQRQQQKLLRTAQLYLQRSNYQGPCRFDVVAISGHDPYDFNWMKSAIQAG